VSLNVSIQPDDTATFTVSSPLGQRVTFDVRFRSVQIGRSGWGGRTYGERYVVGLKGSDGDGFSAHTSFEVACRAALSRARRYEKSLLRSAARKGVAA
jgi:hypothetical protein